MPIILVRNKLGSGKKRAYYPGLASIREERDNVVDESESQSEFIPDSMSFSSDAHSEEFWPEYDSGELVPTVLKREENTIYSALLNITSILQRTEYEEFKYYQTAFNNFLKDYSSYLNNSESFLNGIKAIHATQSNEQVNCCSFFQKKAPTNTVTNKLIMFMIHSAMQLDLAGIQRIQEQLSNSISPTSRSSV